MVDVCLTWTTVTKQVNTKSNRFLSTYVHIKINVNVRAHGFINQLTERITMKPDKPANIINHIGRVKPDFNPDYAVYVQSTSVNRKLKAGTKYLYLVS